MPKRKALGRQAVNEVKLEELERIWKEKRTGTSRN
jgi:hypothetical protein